MLQTLPYEDIETGGDLKRRAFLNYDRMETDEFRYPHVFREGSYSWPGDWEGRAILALTMLARATGREPLHLEEIIARLPGKLNPKGYFGTVHPAGTADEQQLSGHSWFLRGMLEYHAWKGDEYSLGVVETLVRNLLLPQKGLYAVYPVQPEDRKPAGEAIGSLFEGKTGDWYLSTDVGCAFILLDGAAHAYRLLRWPELGSLLEEMIGRFRTLDLTGLSFQTHATLSATRGLLAHYETTGDASLLGLAERIYALYCKEGITENFSNYNWFNRPEWTEPCAVVDSFIVSVELWRHTAEPSYLETAQGILHNGLGHGQRSNGGFGCDHCSGAHDELLYPLEGLYEAFWCCTMRGADGLSRAIGYGYFLDSPKRAIAIPFMQEGAATVRLEDGELRLKQSTSYPVHGSWRLVIEDCSSSAPVTFRVFLPSWAETDKLIFRVGGVPAPVTVSDGFIVWTGTPETGLSLEIEFPVGLREGTPMNVHSVPGLRGFFHGSLMLGALQAQDRLPSLAIGELEPLGNAEYAVRDTGIRLSPIRDIIDRTKEEAIADRRQVLFRPVSL